MEMVKLRYISEKPSIRFKKGKIYRGFRAKDDRRGLFWCFHVEDDDDPGDYGYPAGLFEKVQEDNTEEVIEVL